MRLEPTHQIIDSFIVTGFQVRTKNSDEFNYETAKLPQLWQQLHANNQGSDTVFFGVYSDYESDAQGAYTVTAGIKSKHQNPDNFTQVNVNVQSGTYLVFRGKGEMPLTVVETWKQVWNHFSEKSQYERTFMTDFETYNGDEVAIYIGIKKYNA
jgi:predicted transcriptional regulator YdeE